MNEREKKMTIGIKQLKQVIEINGKNYQRCEITSSIRTANQYLSNQETYGRRHQYILCESRGRLGIYKEIN